MPIYEFRGLNKAGKNVKGTVDAENIRAAKTKLKKDGVFVVDLKDKTKSGKAGKKKKAIMLFVKKLAKMSKPITTNRRDRRLVSCSTTNL